MFDMIKNAMGFGSSIDYTALKQEGVVVVDVRSPMEFQSGCCDGAINIPLDQLDQKLNKIKNKDCAIITCCVSGARSGSAKRSLEAKGYSKVYNGGNWKRVANELRNA